MKYYRRSMFRSTGRKDVNLEKGEGNRRKKSTVTLGHPGAGGLISNGRCGRLNSQTASRKHARITAKVGCL